MVYVSRTHPISLYHVTRGTIRWHQGVRARRRLFGSVRFCRHEARHVQRLLARGRTRAREQGHGKCISEMAVACSERGVPSLRRGRYGANGMYRMLSGALGRRPLHRMAAGHKLHRLARAVKPKKGYAASRSAKIKRSYSNAHKFLYSQFLGIVVP